MKKIMMTIAIIITCTGAWAKDTGWLVRVCRASTDNSIQSIQYVESSPEQATPSQLQIVQPLLTFVTPESILSENNTPPCTCELVAIQPANTIHVEQSLYNSLTENDRQKLMNDLALGAVTPKDTAYKLCLN